MVDISATTASEGRRAFGGFIGPRTLLAQVENAAPWLFAEAPASSVEGPALDALVGRPDGHLAVLRAAARLAPTPDPTAGQWIDYFTLCLAAHFATVATYVPTDVDTKIRAHLWYRDPSSEDRRRLCDLALALGSWDVRALTTRYVDVPGHGWISGHDGERLSVLCGGLMAMLVADDTELAQRLEHAIDEELLREAAAFDALVADGRRDRDLLVLAALLTHNVGDVDQGLSAHEGRRHGALQRVRFAELAGERFERYGGSFGRAAAVYRATLASDGHRHYPLRELKCLRSSPELLLPLAPFLEDWGARVARWPGFDVDRKADVVSALAEGCRKVRGQHGYFRALHGFEGAFPGGLAAEALQRELPASVRRELRDSELRRRIAVRRESFESSLVKLGRAALAAFRPRTR